MKKAVAVPDSTAEPASSGSAFPVVGIGASAGGVEAIRALLAQLPATLGMAVVVVVHLDRNLPSHLAEVLSSVSALPVHEATDGRLLEPNHVYVIPPDRNLAISCGMLQVTPRNEDRLPCERIDCFLMSLARELGEHAIGVILSGTGTDGAGGIREVKSRGGITFAQDEASARQPAMPKAAIATGAVDFVLTPPEIGKELIVLAKATGGRNDKAMLPIAKSEAKVRENLLLLLQSATSVDFTNYKQTTIWRRVNRRLAIQRVSTLREYVDYCRANPVELDALYQDILIHVTSFFRDTEMFEALERRVFPGALQGRSAEEPLRLWVPGCSTGEEAYSLAITLLEYLARENLSVPVQIFGTDINESVIERARAGIYTERIAESVSPERLQRYFTRVKHGYQVTKTLRDLCVFARQNIVSDPPLSKMDLISCRNLLIYLGPTLQRKVIPRLHYALRPDGVLVLGKSEVIDVFADLFTPIDKRTKLYAKKPAASTGIDLGTGPLTSPLGSPRKPPAPAGIFVELEMQREMDRLIATRYSPPAIAINESLDILQVRGDIKPFLDMGSGLWNGNLARLVQHDFARKVRELVARAASGKGGSASLEGLRLRANESVRLVDLKFLPLRSSGDKERRYLLVLEPARPARAPRRTEEAGSSRRMKEILEDNSRLEEELKLTREHLQSTIDEREIRNEELQAANEEILSNNEELQTMNQELETSKEELESSNEELATLNEELQLHLEALRKSEERFRILVSGVKEYAIFMLDSHGVVRSWNEGAERINGYRADEIIGRHFSVFYPPEVARTDKVQKELATAAEQGSFSEEGIRLRKDGARFWAYVVITALFDDKGEVYGFAKVTRDITERKKTEEALRLSEERFRVLVSGVKEYAIFMMDPQGNILSWNEGAERIKGYRPDEIIGKNFSLFYTEADRQRRHPQEELEIAKKVGKYEEEGERVRKDGTRFVANVVITALYGPGGELHGFAKVTRDISEKKRAEMLLRNAHAALEERVREATETIKKEQARLRLITDALPTLISYIDTERRYAFNNEAFTRWFGKPAAEFTGESIKAMAGDDAYRILSPQLDRAFAGETADFESLIRYANGPIRYVHGIYIPDRDGDRVRGVIGLIEDITQRKRHEEDFKRYSDNLARVNAELAASNAELSQFAHVSSHDLKEPLRMVKLYTQLIQDRYRDKIDDKGRQFMSFVIDGATRMDALINDLLAYSAVGRADATMGRADLGRAASLAMSNLRESIAEAQAEVAVGELPTVPGSESLLAQVFQNLIGNAIKFHGEARPRVEIQAAARGSEWLVSVKDNGIGIEAPYLERIFEIFQRLHDRREYPGTGIGLAICRRVVERHGGRIWVESTPGAGSTFCFTLPREDGGSA